MIKISPTNQQLQSIINKGHLKPAQDAYTELFTNIDQSYKLSIAQHPNGYRRVYVNEGLFKIINIKACVNQ